MYDGFWYKARVYSVSTVIDAEREEYGTGNELSISKLRVIKTTPKGVQVQYGFGLEKHFILGTATKQFAAPTIEHALSDLLYVKKRQLSILEARAATVRQQIRRVKINLKRRKKDNESI